jgi:hypothetical protein
MKYAVEMGSGSMIYIPCFIKTGSAIQKVLEGVHRPYGDCISQPLPFLNSESRLQMDIKINVVGGCGGQDSSGSG